MFQDDLTGRTEGHLTSPFRVTTNITGLWCDRDRIRRAVPRVFIVERFRRTTQRPAEIDREATLIFEVQLANSLLVNFDLKKE